MRQICERTCGEAILPTNSNQGRLRHEHKWNRMLQRKNEEMSAHFEVAFPFQPAEVLRI